VAHIKTRFARSRFCISEIHVGILGLMHRHLSPNWAGTFQMQMVS
jgi:hypothetical protein